MSAAPVGKTWYRKDITGLRSIAIIPVVAFHAGAQFIPGGFIGVDVFYVISGFLITTLLLKEAETAGRIRLGTFWAKRTRRLVPALVVVVAISLPIAALLGSVLSWDRLAREAIASVLYVANILFWRESTDYFDTSGGQSPFLHMWSLGVEEQFYVVWPLIIIAAIWVASRRFSLRIVLLVAFSGVFVVSLALSLFFTPIQPTAAFYLLPTRAWEFAGAALIALVPAARMPSSRLYASLLGVAGVAILMFGFVTINESDLYPGHLALVPFVGTILLLISGVGSRSILSPVFESSAAVWIGNVSYSWYLWHWPLIVFAVTLFPGPVGAASAGVISLGVAAASYYFIERPLRFSAALARSVRRTYMAGTIATVAVVAIAGVTIVASSQLREGEPLNSYATAATSLPAVGCDDGILESIGDEKACVLGDPNGDITVAVIGDSHAGHWRDALDAAAQDAGQRLIFRWKSSCPSLDVAVGDERGVVDPTCEPFQQQTMRVLEAVRPDAVIISNAYGYSGKLMDSEGNRMGVDEQDAAWSEATAEQIATIRDLGAVVALIDDNPRMLYNPTMCLSRLGAVAADCASSRTDALQIIAEMKRYTDQVIESQHVSEVLSVTNDICTAERCAAIDADGTPIYQDQTHLSRAWTMKQTPRLTDWLEQIEAATKR